MGNEPLLLAKKAEEMVLYGYQVLRHFPRSERHVLSQEIRQSMWAVLALIERAARARDKIRLLQELDIELALLKQRVRIAHRLGYLPNRQYAVWSEKLVELGRMVGGWLKTARPRG